MNYSQISCFYRYPSYLTPANNKGSLYILHFYFQDTKRYIFTYLTHNSQTPNLKKISDTNKIIFYQCFIYEWKIWSYGQLKQWKNSGIFSFSGDIFIVTKPLSAHQCWCQEPARDRKEREEGSNNYCCNWGVRGCKGH